MGNEILVECIYLPTTRETITRVNRNDGTTYLVEDRSRFDHLEAKAQANPGLWCRMEAGQITVERITPTILL